MAQSDVLELGWVKLQYQNIALANIGDAGGLQPSAAPGNFYAALYTTPITDADTGTEANYTGYARVAVVRSAAGWTAVAGTVGAEITNAALISFPISTGVTNTVTHIGIRTALTLGDLMDHGALTTPLIVLVDDTPKFEIGDFKVTKS